MAITVSYSRKRLTTTYFLIETNPLRQSTFIIVLIVSPFSVFLILIEITINYNVNWFPPHIISKYYFAIHSPEIIPELRIGQEFMVIKPNVNYFVSFSDINVNRYNSETESDCMDYTVVFQPLIRIRVPAIKLSVDKVHFTIFELLLLS